MAARKTVKKTLYVSSATAKTIANYLVEQGMDSGQIEHILGRSLAEIESSDYRIALESYHALWALALNYTENPALGLKLGSKLRNDEMGLVGHIFFNSETLGKALIQLERYCLLENEGVHIEVKTDEELAYINFICDDDYAYCTADMDRTLAIFLYRARQYINPSLSIEFVHFQHPIPSYHEEYAAVLPCPVAFGKDHCCIAFKKRFLDYQLPQRSSYLHKLLTRHVESLLKKLRPKLSLTIEVRKLIEQKLAKDSVDAEHIADKMCMSRHTLYRKLKQEGTAFHELVDQVRKDKALSYIKQNKHSLSEIAFLLGFSELSAFSRAFKRWTGHSPVNYKSKSRR